MVAAFVTWYHAVGEFGQGGAATPLLGVQLSEFGLSEPDPTWHCFGTPRVIVRPLPCCMPIDASDGRCQYQTRESTVARTLGMI